MIVKIKTHKRPSFRTLLNYMIHNKDRLFDENGKSFCITHNVKGKSLDSWVKQFQKNETFRLRKRSDSVYCTHEILSWHKEDAQNITLAKLEEILGEYIKHRNDNGMYIAVPHFDRSHYHVHICASGIEYRTGKTMRLSKTNLQKVKKEIQEFQIKNFPELSKSVVSHGNGKGKESEKVKQFKSYKGRESDKERLLRIMKGCYKKADSRESFFELLNDRGIKSYERGGKVSGVVFQDRKFRLNRLGFAELWVKYLDQVAKRKSTLTKFRENKHQFAKLKEVEWDVYYET